MMVSTICSTKKRIAYLHNNVVLPSYDNDGHLTLFDENYFENNKFLESKRTCRNIVSFLLYINKKNRN